MDAGLLLAIVLVGFIVIGGASKANSNPAMSIIFIPYLAVIALIGGTGLWTFAKFLWRSISQ